MLTGHGGIEMGRALAVSPRAVETHRTNLFAKLGNESLAHLIRGYAPLDHVNNLHWTAVIESIVLGNGGPRHQEVLRALLAAGASTRLADRQGTTPLTLAKFRGYGEMVQMLETAGAK